MATGKISRLPQEIREQLNERMVGGEPGKRLVIWLNALPAVRELLAAEFGGAAINEQNLTNWKQGGFRDWRREQEVAAWGRQLAGEKPVPVTTADLLTLATTRYLVLADDCRQHPDENPNRQWRRWRSMCHDLVKLRRSEHQAGRLKLDGEWLQFAQERFEDAKLAGDRRAMVSFLVAARQWPEVQAALTTAFQLFQERKGVLKEGNQAESGPIKVDQGEIFSAKEQETQAGLVISPRPWSGSRPQSAGGAGKICRSATDSTSHGLHNGQVHLGKEWKTGGKPADCSPASCRGPSRTGSARRSELAGQRPALPVVACGVWWTWLN